MYFPVDRFVIAMVIGVALSLFIRFIFDHLPMIARQREFLGALPSVRNPSPLNIIAREAVFSAEIIVAVAAFGLIHWALPFPGTGNGFIYAFAIIILRIVPNAADRLFRTHYPYILVVLDASRDTIAFIAVGLCCGLAFL
ncbi:MAG: hypothetical protein HZC28_00850 [Spirochaetes bacterium]|nr:hypothetical protein [Spirochaetota bacterium]